MFLSEQNSHVIYKIQQSSIPASPGQEAKILYRRAAEAPPARAAANFLYPGRTQDPRRAPCATPGQFLSGFRAALCVQPEFGDCRCPARLRKPGDRERPPRPYARAP